MASQFTSEEYAIARDPAVCTAAGSVRLALLISIAGAKFSPVALGNRYEEAVALLVLHWLVLETIGGSSGAGSIVGQVTQEKEGELSRSYATPDASNDLFPFLSSTSYGRELDSLIRSTVVAFGVTGSMFNAADL